MTTGQPIEGFPGYRITTEGVGWSCRVPKSGRMGDRWKRLKPITDKSNAYPHFHLRRDGKTFKRYVHRLVLETFVGPCPDGMECCHGDGDRSNCRLDNLRWGTPSSNQADRVEHGTSNRGRRQHMAKLTELDIPEIFAVRRDIPGATLEEIGILFGVSKGAIQGVLERKNWGWVHVEDHG